MFRCLTQHRTQLVHICALLLANDHLRAGSCEDHHGAAWLGEMRVHEGGGVEAPDVPMPYPARACAVRARMCVALVKSIMAAWLE